MPMIPINIDLINYIFVVLGCSFYTMIMGCPPFDTFDQIVDFEYGAFDEDIDEESMLIFFNLVQTDYEARKY